ncbi:hypothetical protein [Flavobacterium sp.]|uniref:hypothetical protein n=1 Tax=Flavobacterium sp. TaxID=239 RepID=UPI0032678295
MSWDIVLFNSVQKINVIDEVDEEKLIPIAFDKIISEHFGLEESGEMKGDDFSIDFYKDDEPVSNKMISLYGEKALFEIARLAKIQNWQIFDTSLNKMIDLENLTENGFANFQSYLQKSWISNNQFIFLLKPES